MASAEEFNQEINVGKVAIPALSSLLDVRVPFVQLESERLQASVSWLYGAVQALQQQCLGLNSRLEHLQEMSTPSLQASPLSPLPLDAEDGRMQLWQHEQKRAAEQAQVELRFQALSASVESRLQHADLEALEGKMTRRLDEISQHSKQEISSLARLLEGSVSADRRQLQEQFEALRCKVEAQLDVLSASGVQNAVKALRQAPREPPLPHAVLSREMPEETAFSPERTSGTGLGAEQALQSRLEQLEQSLQRLSQRGAPRAEETSGSVPGMDGDAVWQRFTDVDQAHIMTVQRISEMETRLARVEGKGPGRRQRDGTGKLAQAGDWEVPMSELQSSHASLAEEVAAHVLPAVSTLRSTLTQITKYISGDAPEEDMATSMKSVNALDWLQQRVGALTKEKGHTLEARLQLLEQATGSTEIFQKVQNLEQILGKLDVDAVNEVPPQLIIVKEDQEVFKQDLRREVQELKVLVGCMEACVPKETRKAIQLFKRGAGVSDEEFITAGGLKLYADVEALREELQVRLADVETNSAQQHDSLNSMVQDLETKQERLSSAFRKRFASDDATQHPFTSVEGRPGAPGTSWLGSTPRLELIGDLSVDVLMAPSAFEELCRERDVKPEEWRAKLATPIVADKSLQEMTDSEIEDYNRKVQERAQEVRKDRALLALEKAQDGRLERKATKVWNQHAKERVKIPAEQVPEMLESLTFEVSNNEMHFLLGIFGATQGSDIDLEHELTQNDWHWLVGECQILKESYKFFFRREEWEVQYTDQLQKLTLKDLWTTKLSNQGAHKIGWWWTTGEKAGQASVLQKFAWGAQPEVEEELLGKMELVIGPRLKDADGKQSME
ncbi:unnamed protein product [Symbiodinium sp. CCMP2456]|nr:unnamed protein product [Symbiodinium sp. CCMP2456]